MNAHQPDDSIKRRALRHAMSECPACSATDADLISEVDLDRWLLSHGIIDLSKAPQMSREEASTHEDE
jgi:hypothetical protein